MIYFYLITSFLLNASANIALRAGAQAGLQYRGLGLIEIIRMNAMTLIGIGIFATSAITYFMTLKSMPVSIAYPVIVGMSFLVTNMGAHFYLHEKIYVGQIFGYALLLAGIILIFSFGYRQQ